MLPPEDAVQLMLGSIRYVESGQALALSSAAAMVFSFMTSQLGLDR